jgi:TRAP-type C4-dicarboxylate transport system substrate-binding protein
MIGSSFLKTVSAATLCLGMLAGGVSTALAADYTLRATANSNENDEDYDGLIVFKDYVEKASNGAIEVELFIGTQLCSTGAECLQGIADGSIDIYISTSGGAAGHLPLRAGARPALSAADDRIAEAVLTEGTFTRALRETDAGRFGRYDPPDDHRQHRRLAQLSPTRKSAIRSRPTWKG